MSRCFPYPLPPEYCDDDLTAAFELGDDSKKINKSDRKKDKERRKEQKREKKERREKEKNDKDGQSCEFESKKHRHKKRRKDDEGTIHEKGGDHLKTREDELEQLEKSSLTEECGQPTSTQALYDSSDSTQNSNKRKKQAASSIDSSHKLGSILRIRLPLLKHNAPEVPQQKEQECSTSGRLVIHGPKVSYITPRQVSDSTPRSGCTSGGNAITPAEDTFSKTPAEEKATPIADSTRFLVSGPPKIFTEYRDLVENWIPPLIQSELDLDDQDWLFDSNKRQPQQHIARRGDYDALARKSSSLWPSACYLAAADIYALPYTVPF